MDGLSRKRIPPVNIPEHYADREALLAAIARARQDLADADRRVDQARHQLARAIIAWGATAALLATVLRHGGRS